MFNGVHGKLNDIVFRQTPSGGISMIKRADMSRVEWSQAQKDQRQRFRETNEYAQSAMADENLRIVYEQVAKEQGRTSYRVAFSDCFQEGKLAAGTE